MRSRRRCVDRVLPRRIVHVVLAIQSPLQHHRVLFAVEHDKQSEKNCVGRSSAFNTCRRRMLKNVAMPFRAPPPVRGIGVGAYAL